MTREMCMGEEDKRNESNAWTFSFVQNHALHNIYILHQAYVFFSSETGISLAPEKSFRKTFGEKEDNSNRLEFQPSQNSTNWQPG